MTCVLMTTTALTAIAMATGSWSDVSAQQRPVFSAAARLVPVSVTVRDEHGKPVVGLSQADFEVLSDDRAQEITEFRSEPSALTTALLVDNSGSMRVSSGSEDVAETAHHLVSWMTPGTDRIGVFAFDTSFTQTSPFAAVSTDSLAGLKMASPFGATSLYDAVDATSVALVREGSPRRAVVAITDGVDNASTLTAEEVGMRAAAIDVPVYIVAVARRAGQSSDDMSSQPEHAALTALTTRTGGQLFVATGPSQASHAARTIITELRQQYLLAFVPDSRPGWHRLTVRIRQPRMTARARAGYITR